MNITDFFKGFTTAKPIMIGDRCRHKVTRVHSICLNIHAGFYFGRLPDSKLTMEKIENIEKI